MLPHNRPPLIPPTDAESPSANSRQSEMGSEIPSAEEVNDSSSCEDFGPLLAD